MVFLYLYMAFSKIFNSQFHQKMLRYTKGNPKRYIYSGQSAQNQAQAIWQEVPRKQKGDYLYAGIY